MKYKKFTNEVRLKVQAQGSLNSQKEYLLDWMQETKDPKYFKLRLQIQKTNRDIDLQKIMFNMQLLSEGLGV
jgi:hypothetical protein